jgi:hypothetical protein
MTTARIGGGIATRLFRAMHYQRRARLPDMSANNASDQLPQKRLGGVSGKGFMPGASGNPGGRPRGIEARAREFTEEALQALRAALQNPRERVAAATVLLSYGWGRPKQVIEANDAASITIMHLTAARDISAEMHAALPMIEGAAEPDKAKSANGQLLGPITPALE